ncbi:MAG TPA: ABC transporter transmembrane domain-containing protein [Caulobacteraceae bacterium]|nr:ABC transporter transmembrane domain-containing protein [Caulobacteraceae bacterium]
MTAAPRPGSAAPSTELSSRALIARLWRDYLRPRWLPLLGSVLCAAIAAGITAQLAQIIEPAVNRLLVARDAQALWVIPLTIVALALPRAAIQYAQAVLVNRVGHGLVGQIQVQLFSRLVRADLARLRDAHSGSYVSSVLFDATLIRQAATDGVVKFTQHALIAVSLAIWLLWIDWILGAMVLTVAPVASILLRRFSKRTRKAARGAMAETSNLSTALMESLDGVKIVKIENREAFEEERVGAVVDRRQRHLIKGGTAEATAGPTTEALMTCLLAAIFAYVGWRAQAGGMSVGAFSSFLVSLAILTQSIKELANLQTVMSEGFAAFRRLLAAVDIEPEVKDPAAPVPLPAGPAELVFDKVSFAYQKGGAPALHGMDLRAAPGETIALVGPSGGGKSTILNLIPRFYDADAGTVRINGVDIRDVTMTELRARIALVTQEPFLFDDTIRANIAYARPDASEAEIRAAAEAAAAHEFIEALPKGYDTTVGEAGARLSGGQRQRIAIARAFLKDAPILLLDEATSALDTESEAKVQEALERLMVGRTTVMIAHRLSTVAHADRIYVIEAGRLVEQGAHAALLRKGGLYARLARGQNLEQAAPEAALGVPVE